MPLFLASHIHAAVIGRDVVLLDVARDEYFCVREGLEALGLAANLRDLAPPDPALGAALVEDGFVERGASPAPPQRPPDAPDRDLPASCADPVNVRDLVRLGAALWDFVVHYRGRSFADILAYAGGGRAAVDPTETLRLARVFARAAPWLPLPRQCLVRSFVLLRFLQRSGTGAQWVLGVRTWPFAAHCWLQLGGTVLDDSADRLAAFHPILVVGS